MGWLEMTWMAYVLQHTGPVCQVFVATKVLLRCGAVRCHWYCHILHACIRQLTASESLDHLYLA